jgi:hypothetical protein
MSRASNLLIPFKHATACLQDLPKQVALNHYRRVEGLEEMIVFIEQSVFALEGFPAHQLEMRALLVHFRNLLP